MKKWTNVLRAFSILSFALIVACATSQTSPKPIISTSNQPSDSVAAQAPKIPINADDAFFPMHATENGVFYSWEDCNWLGLNCKYKEVVFRFDDKATMEWFKANDFGFKKRQRP